MILEPLRFRESRARRYTKIFMPKSRRAAALFLFANEAYNRAIGYPLTPIRYTLSMDFRTRRQLAVLALVGLVIAAVGFLAAKRLIPKPSCSDTRQNQNEEEADCGGPCLPCVFKHQKDVEVFWTRFVKVRGNTYDVAAEIRNPNVKLAAAHFDYEFKLFDESGFLVASRRGTSFIYPGETVHLAEVGIVSGRIVRDASITFENFKWILTEAQSPDIIAGNREYVIEVANGARSSVIKALIGNRTLSDFSEIEVSALAFDERGNLLGVNRTILRQVLAGETKAVKFSWPIVFSEDVSSLVVEARSNIAIPSAAH